jgi:leucyl-tRNA synthetase
MAEAHGADALRVYLLFMAPFENSTIWEQEGINGARRFLERTWRLANDVADAGPTEAAISQDGAAEARLARVVRRTIAQVTAEIERMAFNTAVAALMKCLNAMAEYRAERGVTPGLAAATRDFVLVLAPFAPFIAEALWQRLGGAYSVHSQPWPEHGEPEETGETATVVVQVDGRVRGRVEVSADAGDDEVAEIALANPPVQRALGQSQVARVVFVPGRLINFVTG